MLLKRDEVSNIILAFAGIVLIGIGVAFNAAAALGNDPIGIVYDGIRNTANLSSEQLGTASNIVNIILVIVVFLLDRHYVDIGTFIYIIPYGFVVDLGNKLYHVIIKNQTLLFQIAGAFMGCLLLYTGVAMFITADTGLDPFTGVVMVLKDKVGKEYRTMKVCFDTGCIVLGFVLGGKLGTITIITALTAGPVIQFLSNIMQNRIKI